MADTSFTPPMKFALKDALPFWLSLSLVPVIGLGAWFGGWTIALGFLYTWFAFTILDGLLGTYEANEDPATPDDKLFWHRLITIVWVPVQFCLIFGMLIWVIQTDHLTGWEEFWLFFSVGIATGTVGINYSHELMHQKSRLERLLADLLLAMVLYSHFRSEHLLVHHRYVGTPRDPVTAHYNEGFHRFFPRVLWQCLRSAFRAEAAMLARKGKSWTDRENPFWVYWALQAAFLALALFIGEWWGFFLFAWQAFVAVWQLELVNYIEHYGLTRKHLGDGKYEHVQPHHSWNSALTASNWLLINLQRHSDHHYKPDRRYPLLQTYSDDEAPNLPFGYPIMTALAMTPMAWRRVMNPKVRAWRKKYYPEIEDWTHYKEGTNPLPR